MQDIHSIGGGGRLFGGGGDRRLRPHHQQTHQALKCPRCDSLNTKFCYYNNYNLSQPRHFCKSCRRYWTKGGVLRNVPVGGGCRKAKRTKSRPASSDSAAAVTATATITTTTTTTQQQREHKSSSNSSSESSSLTAANSNTVIATTTTNTGAVAVATAAEAVSALSSGSVSNLLNGDSKFYGHANPNCGFEPALLEQGSDCGIFSEIGTFTSLMTSSSNETLPFGFGTILNQHSLEQVDQQWQQQHQKMVSMGGTSNGEKLKMQEITGGVLDQTVQTELSALHDRSANGGFGSLDWQGGDDQGLFDLPDAVDQSYWSQSQWTDQDQPSLYLP